MLTVIFLVSFAGVAGMFALKAVELRRGKKDVFLKTLSKCDLFVHVRFEQLLKLGYRTERTFKFFVYKKVPAAASDLANNVSDKIAEKRKYFAEASRGSRVLRGSSGSFFLRRLAQYRKSLPREQFGENN